MEKTYLAKDISNINMIAKKLLNLSKDNKIFAFYGDLGIGKTTFIKELCKILGVKDRVSSPTFSIVNEYHNNESVYHLDLYRLQKKEEAFDIGIEQYIDSGNYCFIEWPAKIQALLPENVIKIFMKLKKDQSRIITIQKQ